MSRDEDCGELRMPSGAWNDETCHSRRSYVCEINGKYNILHEHIYMQTIDGLKLVLSQGVLNKCLYGEAPPPIFHEKGNPSAYLLLTQ